MLVEMFLVREKRFDVALINMYDFPPYYWVRPARPARACY